MLTVAQVAGRLGVKPALIYRLVGRGEIAHARVGIGRGVIRIEATAVEDYLTRKRRAVTMPEVKREKKRASVPMLKHLPLD